MRRLIFFLAPALCIACCRPPTASIVHAVTDSVSIKDSAIVRQTTALLPHDRANIVFKIECDGIKPVVLPVFNTSGQFIEMSHRVNDNLLNVVAAVIDSAAVAVEYVERHREIIDKHNERIEVPVYIEKKLHWYEKIAMILGYIAAGMGIAAVGFFVYKLKT